MSKPSVAGILGGIGGVDVGTHTFSVPSGAVAGEKLLLIIAAYAGTAGAADFETPSGWSVGVMNFNEKITLSVFEKTSTGGESTVALAGQGGTISYGYVLRVSEWADIEYATVAEQGSSSSVNFITAPTVTPSWTEDTLYLVIGANGRSNQLFDTPVTGYTSLAGVSGENAAGRGVGLIVGHKQGASATESPGDLTAGTYSNYNSVTIALKAAPAPVPTVTTTDTLQPGESFTLTATNYASAPVSPATFTDSEGSTITVPVTISGSGPYTAVGTMPTLAEAVTAGTSLLFGDVTIELST